MNKPRMQGTAFETWLVKWLNRISGVVAERLAEGGSQDQGDIRFYDMFEQVWYVECKAREVLNVTRELSKARLKSPDPQHTVLAWKRLVKNGGKRRVSDGEPVVIVMGLDTLHSLLGKHPDD